MSIAVLIPAAGTSTRFGPLNKLTTRLAGLPVMAHTLQAFARRTDVVRIIVATRDPALIDICAEFDIVRCVPGAENRSASVRATLAALPPEIDVVCVHDAARPLVTQPLIDRCFAAAAELGAVAAAVPMTSTVKRAASVELPAKVEATLDRSTLFCLQTPQVMKLSLLQRAYHDTPLDLADVTDDLQLLESIGIDVHLVSGELDNLKITHAQDLLIAESHLRARAYAARS
ncbi:MAG: 2-C-methyl-D-erythritol 4-phosphate cytidylyltransferase [Phycisphaerae bacterium]